MKKAKKHIQIAAFILLAISSFYTVAAQNSKNEQNKSLKQLVVKSSIDSQNFVFVPRSLTPLRGRTRYLTSEYKVRITKDSVISYLPYFGRSYTVPADPTRIGFDFSSTQFEYKKTEHKKGGWDIIIKPKNVNVRQFIFHIFENGSASLTVLSDNDSISYQGYVADKS